MLHATDTGLRLRERATRRAWWLVRALLRAHPLALTGAGVAVFALAIRIGVAARYGGPHVGGDSSFYMSNAAQLLARGPGALADINLISAPLYPVFLALAAWVTRTDVVGAAILGQAVLGALTAALLVRITFRLSHSLFSAALAGAIAATEISFLFWGVLVVTETLFLFVLALCVDRLLVLTASRRPVLDAFVAGLCVLVALFARPTAASFALIVPIYVWVAATGRRARLVRTAATVMGIGMVLFVATALLGLAGGFGDQIANVIWSAVWVGLQWTEQGRATGGVDIVLEPPGGVFRDGVLNWLGADPMYFVLQMVRKFKIFWTPVLPEFSVFHSLVNLAYYVPFYGLAVNGTRLVPRNRAGLSLLLLGIASFTVTSMITFVDYDQRYRLPAELLLIPLAAIGATPLIEGAATRLRARRNHRPGVPHGPRHAAA